MNNQKQELITIIEMVRSAVTANSFSEKELEISITKLDAIGYRYRSESFPALPLKKKWRKASPDFPKTLAEALLWKLGKWNSYQNFSDYFSGAESTPKKTDVVFYAFAEHLKDAANPIYDQHALRALWAIDPFLSKEEFLICQSVLVRGAGWKAVVSGVHTSDAYEWFVMRIKKIETLHSSLSLAKLDKLLMPLGQAIKKELAPGSQCIVRNFV